MSPTFMLAIAAAIIVAFLMLRKRNFPQLDGWIREAIDAKSVDGLIQKIREQGPGVRSVLFQRSISTLWSEWQRPLAIYLIQAFAREHSEEKICQYWLKTAMEVEPAVVRKIFEEGFWEAHYRPEVAKQCGLTGS